MPKKIPMRSCTGCGQVREKKELVRIVRTPEGKIEADLTGRRNGRGAYICPNPACIDKARKRRSLSRSLGCEIPDEIYEELRSAVTRQEQAE